MAKIKTTATAKSVTAFIDKIADETRRDDSFQLIKLFKEITGEEAVLWGPSIIGFGKYHYKYASGHEGDMPLVAFSPRKTAIVVYVLDISDRENLLKKLGKHTSSKGCVYIKQLADVDLGVLKKMVVDSMEYTVKLYGK